jgi:hypothetical protein
MINATPKIEYLDLSIDFGTKIILEAPQYSDWNISDKIELDTQKD